MRTPAPSKQAFSTEGMIYLNSAADRLWWRVGSGNTIEIVDIEVMSERRKGVGRKLVETLLNQLDPDTRVYAITRVDNEIAMQFYEALQFRTVNILRRFYADEKCVDALMFCRKAGGPV